MPGIRYIVEELGDPRSRKLPRREHTRSRPRLPALFGLALQSGAALGGSDGFAAIKRGEPPAELAIEFRQLSGAGGIVFFEETQRFPDDFAFCNSRLATVEVRGLFVGKYASTLASSSLAISTYMDAIEFTSV
jgi:hypothetical protein